MGSSAIAATQSQPWIIDPGALRDVSIQVLNEKIAGNANSKVVGNKDNTLVRSPKPETPGSKPSLPIDASPEETERASKRSWLEKSVVDRLKIVGNRRIGYHAHKVDGDLDTFNSLNYYGRGDRRFTDTGQINVSGRDVLGFLTFDLAYSSDDLNDPDAQRVTLGYHKGPVRLAVGDISGRLLNTNPYASFSRNLRGASFDYNSGRFAARVLHTEAKGSSKTISIQGNNSLGPYYLQSGRVVPDSVEVQVDGRAMLLAEDYVVNADIGSITFVDRIVSPTSTIIVTYESYGLGTQGVIQGAGMSYDLGKFGRIGLTGMSQQSGVTGAGNTIVQRFFGYGSAGAQYWLDYEPLPGSVRIKVDGIPQIEGPADSPGGDYYFDPATPFVFYFKRSVAPTQQIDVVYRPRNVQNLDGDRRVWGFDYRLPLGGPDSDNYLQYSQATGKLLSESNPMDGTARGVEGQYKLGDVTFRGAVRDIPRTYVSVESRGFQRNEKATELAVEWNRGRYSFSASSDNSSISTRETGTDGLHWKNSRYTRTEAAVGYLEPSGATWQVSHSRLRSRYVDDTSLDTTGVNGKRRFGKIDVDYGFENQTGFGPISDGFSTTRGSVQLQTASVGARYRIPSGLSLGARASVSRITALEKTGNGSDYSMSLNYQPEAGRLKANASYSVSDSGQLATLGDFGSGGFGYGGNGFSGGAVGGSFTAGDSSLKALALNAEYEASRKVSLGLHATTSDQKGSFRSNSRTNAVGLSVDMDLGNLNQVGLGISQTQTSFYSDLAQKSNSLSLDAYWSGAPLGPWFYRLGLSHFVSESASLYSQDAFSLDATLGYKLTPRQRLWLQYRTGKTTGLYGQLEDALYLSYEHQLFQNVSLIGGYKWRDVRNLSQELTGGSYRSSGFDIELSFDFR